MAVTFYKTMVQIESFIEIQNTLQYCSWDILAYLEEISRLPIKTVFFFFFLQIAWTWSISLYKTLFSSLYFFFSSEWQIVVKEALQITHERFDLPAVLAAGISPARGSGMRSPPFVRLGESEKYP